MTDNRVRVAALILAGVSLTVGAFSARAEAISAASATTVAYAESPADALARNMRLLAINPQDFDALIGAGKAALALDDTQAAAGFFGRAQERWPSSPMPMAGIGAALVADGDAQGALTYFRRAEALGANAATFAADRGLAYDLLGRHAEAQADYRVALTGRDRDEARRRLALSLAVTGKKDEAIATLAPLMARGDAGAARCRAMILAVSGDSEGAKRTIDTAMPGAAAQMGPFLRRLPTLSSTQKIAAVNLGIFPGAGQPGYSQSLAAPSYSGGLGAVTASNSTNPVTGDRLAGIEALLSGKVVSDTVDGDAAPRSDAIATYQPAPPVQMASIPGPQARAPAMTTTAKAPPGRATSAKRYWVQLASGANPNALPAEFQRIRRKDADLLDKLSPYVASDGERARLLVGPFKDAADAAEFADALESSRIDAFSWTSQPGQPVRKISE